MSIQKEIKAAIGELLQAAWIAGYRPREDYANNPESIAKGLLMAIFGCASGKLSISTFGESLTLNFTGLHGIKDHYPPDFRVEFHSVKGHKDNYSVPIKTALLPIMREYLSNHAYEQVHLRMLDITFMDIEYGHVLGKPFLSVQMDAAKRGGAFEGKWTMVRYCTDEPDPV